MSHALGWVFVAICAICAPLLVVLSFILPGVSSPGGVPVGILPFLIPVGLSWLAVFPRTRKEWSDLRHGHPLAQRFFGGKAAGFFGDYRRRLTPLGSGLFFGVLALFLLGFYLGKVHVELFIVGFLFLVALSSWIIRLEINGDRLASAIRKIGSSLVYRPVSHHGS